MKKIFLMAASAALLFASCGKEDNGNAVTDGTAATVDLVIKLPQVKTRASDLNATPAEVQVNSIRVFIFDAVTGAAATGNDAVTLASFTAGTNNTYTLPEAQRITTTSGAKHIYVGLNLPAYFATVGNESTFLSAVQVAAAALQDASGGMSMIGTADQTLSAQVVGSTPTVNTVTISVERLAAKISATADAGGITPPAATAGGAFTVALDQYTVGNTAKSYFPRQKVAGSLLVTPSDANPTKAALVDGVQTLVPFGQLSSVLPNLRTNTFYIPEHTPSIQKLNTESTYAVFRGRFGYSFAAKVVAGVVNITTAAAAVKPAELYVVRTLTDTYFCESTTDRDAVAAALTTASVTPTVNKYELDVATGEYYTYYYSYINKLETEPLAVYRNQYINLNITQIKGMGTPGAPGAPGTPPVTPPGPDTPVVQSTAYLEVTADVQPWDYQSTDIPLE
jgi:hypothetical protein